MGEMRELGFIGAGNMATALCRGVVRAGLVEASDIIASDPDERQRRRFAEATGAGTTASNEEACCARVVVLAVKPNVAPAALAEIGPALPADTFVISVVAGISTPAIDAAAGRALRVIRAMPNTPMLVGEGAAALCKGANATDADLARARQLFEASATVIEVGEPAMHAVTALSGSGPAYVFYLAEIMAQAGAELGLSESDAVTLAARTIFGAGKMLAETGEGAAALRDKVTTPGGTTAAALASMADDGVAEAIVKAIKAAARRSEELGTADS